MPTFRAYTLDPAGRITWGEWIEADDLETAREQAHEMCDDGHPVVELWQGARKLDAIICSED